MTLTQLFTNIANAIRSKKGTSGTIVAENFPQEISSIVTPNLQSKSVSITQNGTTTVTPDNNYNGLDEVAITTNVEQDVIIDTSVTTNINNRTFGSFVTRINKIDTTGMTNMTRLFYGSDNLEYVPVIDATNVTNAQGFYRMYTSVGEHLTDQALDNILQMCISATSYTGQKTLQYGLSLSPQRIPDYETRIPALPHYQEWIDAGWSIS